MGAVFFYAQFVWPIIGRHVTYYQRAGMVCGLSADSEYPGRRGSPGQPVKTKVKNPLSAKRLGRPLRMVGSRRIS